MKQRSTKKFLMCSTLYANLNIIKKYMAYEKTFPVGSKKTTERSEKIAAQYDNMIVMFNDPDAANKPPTKWKTTGQALWDQ